MCQFMGERENLGSFGITAVDEDEGRNLITDRKSAKLLDGQSPGRVVAHNSAAHHQNAKCFGALDETHKEILPSRAFLSQLVVDAQLIRHVLSNGVDIAVCTKAADKVQ